MSRIPTKSAVERLLLDALAARGWAVIGAERRGEDLELRVQCSGDPGRLLFVHEPREETAELFSAVGFLRIDLGEPTGDLDLWCVTEDEFPTADPDEGRRRLASQVALGPTWTSIGSGVLGTPELEIWRMFAGALLIRAERLRPGRPAEQRQEYLEGLVSELPALKPFSSTRWGAIAAGGVVMALIGFGLGSGAVATMGWIVAAVGLVVTALVVGANRLINRRFRGHWEGVEEALRTDDAFSRFKPTASSDAQVLVPVVGLDGESRPKASRSELRRLRGTARSQRHRVRAEIELTWIDWEIDWLGHLSTVDECRILPDRWITVMLVGPEPELDQLPPGPRQKRSSGAVRWTFTGDELDRGVAGRQFATTAAAFGLTQRGPYR